MTAYLELLRLELRPGERLLESDLEQRTRLGRTPIREALFQLVREGLVVKDSRGFLVAELSAEKVAELYEVREALEALAAERAVARVRDEALQEFVRAVAVHGSVPVHGKSCRIRRENVRGRNTSGFLKRWCAATETQRRPLSGLTSARPASGSSACLS